MFDRPMMLVISISHVDSRQALRLLKWIGFLSSKHGNSMLGESCLLVVSRRAARNEERFKELCWLASKIFREARCYVPDTEYEHGWPASANWQFAQALFHVEQHFHEPMFFLEPDGIPTRAEWWDLLSAEWEVAKEHGKSFMGCFVPHTIDHMSGIACYGADWRSLAPTLVNVPDHEAWDVYSAGQVLPHFWETKLIQHMFKRHQPGWTVPSTALISRRSCLFHQDKLGNLITMLDAEQYGSACIDHPLWGFRHLLGHQSTMRKFYYAGTASLPKQVGFAEFQFEKLEPFGGAIPGVYTTDLEHEQELLIQLVDNPASGVTEITQEEWERITKKKSPSQPIPTSEVSAKPPSAIQGPPVLPTPSRSPAVLVGESSNPGSSEPVGNKEPIKNISEVIKTGTVKPSSKTVRPRKPTGKAT